MNASRLINRIGLSIFLALFAAVALSQQVSIPPPGAGQVPGTVTNDNGCAGCVGEYLFANGGNIGTGDGTITVTIASPAVVTFGSIPYSGAGTWTAAINFTTTGALPTGIVSGTTYWVIGSTVSGNTFQIATSVANAIAGTAINTSGTQSGVHTGLVGVASVSTATSTDMAAVQLTAGDWDVWGVSAFIPAGSTVVTAAAAGISSASNTLPTRPDTAFNQGTLGTGLLQVISAPHLRASLSATTTYYIEGYTAFSASTMRGAGSIKARRRR